MTPLKGAKPKVAILSGHGLNCEDETKRAFEAAGAVGALLHVDALAQQPKTLLNYEILAIPGGFSFGDHLGAGKALANRLSGGLAESITAFLAQDRLAIGICNGCQTLIKSGLWTDQQSQRSTVGIAVNNGGRYLCHWTRLKVHDDQSPWLNGITELDLPIAHGEGRFVSVDGSSLPTALKYSGDNPNGSFEETAAVVGYNGRLIAMMPHPERALLFHHKPTWTLEREQRLRAGQKMPVYADGYSLFANAVRWFG